MESFIADSQVHEYSIMGYGNYPRSEIEMTLDEFTERVNEYGSKKIPFLFLVDFEMLKPVVLRTNEINPSEILYNINGYKNAGASVKKSAVSILLKSPISLDEYRKRFDVVYHHLSYGDTYLTNLTTKTEIITDHTLSEMFFLSHAKYKLLFNDEFLVFSPETFVQIKDNRIFSYPMKGTINAALPNAREEILNNQKEMAEHVTIVDLIRNDLSQVATNVQVTKFRYIDEIKTNQKNLLQVSSEITGQLASDYNTHIGNILVKLLPAGSVSGAPKSKTLEIIKESEAEKRGYYTGVMGYYDGTFLDCGVMIRFIEKQGQKYFYRSGGGITTQSVLKTEYQETIDKVYIPTA